MTHNEKIIIMLLAQYKKLSKREIQSKGKMSWTTAVKMVSRLEETNIIKISGTQERNYITGKNAQLYELTSNKPLFIGIDIEYIQTTFLLTNLRGDEIKKLVLNTPEFRNINEAAEYIKKNTEQFINNIKKDQIYGMGIGIPLFLCPCKGNIFKEIQERVIEDLDMHVIVDNAIRAYVLDRQMFLPQNENTIHLIIRGGIGSGIYIDNKIYRGDNLLSGEISHIKVSDNKIVCRCGKTGCLETLVNENIIFDNYIKINFANAKTDKHEALLDLFERCSIGDKRAISLVKQSMQDLAKGIIPMILILDISHISIAGNFGDKGLCLLPFLKSELNSNLPFNSNLNIIYESTSDYRMAIGAARLMFYDFLGNIN